MPRFKKIAFFLIFTLCTLLLTSTTTVYAGKNDWSKVDEWDAEYMQMFSDECENLSQSLKLSTDLGFNSFIAGNTCNIPEVSFYLKSNGGEVGFGWVNAEETERNKGTSMWIFRSSEKAKSVLAKMYEQLKSSIKEGADSYKKENPKVQINVIEDLEENVSTGDGGKIFKRETEYIDPYEGFAFISVVNQDYRYYSALKDLLYSTGKCIVQIRGYASSDDQGGLNANKTILDQKFAEYTDKTVNGLQEVCKEGAVGSSTFNFPFLNLGTFILVLTIIFILFLIKTGVHIPVIIAVAAVGSLISLYNFGVLNLGFLKTTSQSTNSTTLQGSASDSARGKSEPQIMENTQAPSSTASATPSSTKSPVIASGWLPLPGYTFNPPKNWKKTEYPRSGGTLTVVYESPKDSRTKIYISFIEDRDTTYEQVIKKFKSPSKRTFPRNLNGLDGYTADSTDYQINPDRHFEFTSYKNNFIINIRGDAAEKEWPIYEDDIKKAIDSFKLE